MMTAVSTSIRSSLEKTTTEEEYISEPLNKKLKTLENSVEEMKTSLEQCQWYSEKFERTLPIIQNLSNLFALDSNSNLESRIPHVFQPKLKNG